MGNPLSDQAWSSYRSSLARVVEAYIPETPSSEISLVTSPTSPEEIISSLEIPRRVDGVVDTSENICDHLSKALIRRRQPQEFIKFKSLLMKNNGCRFVETSRSQYKKNNSFTITGSKIVNEKVIHQRQSFITTDGMHHVHVNAFNPRGDLHSCKSKLPKSKFSSYRTIDKRYETALNFIISEVAPSLFTPFVEDPANDDLDRTFQRYYDSSTYTYADYEGNGMDYHRNLLQNADRLDVVSMRSCVQQKLKDLFINQKSLSLKEFRLEFKFDHMTVIQLKNPIFDHMRPLLEGASLGFSLPRELIVAHRPSVLMSLSQDDLGVVVSAFDSKKSLVVGGIRFDHIRIVKEGDDDSDFFLRGGRIHGEPVRFFSDAWREQQVACVKQCITAYSKATDEEIVRKEFELSQCACQCAYVYSTKYGRWISSIYPQLLNKESEAFMFSQNIPGRKRKAEVECILPTSRFQVELSSSSDEVLAVVSEQV